jgi:hypothetical protein
VSKTVVVDYLHPRNPYLPILEGTIFEEFCCDSSFYLLKDHFVGVDERFVKYGLKPLAYIVEQYFGGKHILVKKFADYIDTVHRDFALATAVELV